MTNLMLDTDICFRMYTGSTLIESHKIAVRCEGVLVDIAEGSLASVCRTGGAALLREQSADTRSGLRLSVCLSVVQTVNTPATKDQIYIPCVPCNVQKRTCQGTKKCV